MSQTTLSWGCESSIGVVSAPRQRQMRCYCVVRRHYSPNLQLRNWFCQQIPHADQVVGSAGQAEDPTDVQGSAMSYLGAAERLSSASQSTLRSVGVSSG